MLARDLGRRVRTLREALGVTQEKTAYEVGIWKGTLSKIESGQQLPTLGVLELLAGRLGVEILDLLVTPDPSHLRHRVIDATRDLSPEALRALLTALRLRPAAAPPEELPFTETAPPDAITDPPASVPLLGLDVAAGGFDGTRVDRGTRWVIPRTRRKLHRGCFVARVLGRSMEPTIPSGAYVLFSAPVHGDPSGKVVLAQYRGLIDADTAASYTVKRFRGVRAPEGSDAPWSEIRLAPDNPAFGPIVLDGGHLGDVRIAAELLEVLTPNSPA